MSAAQQMYINSGVTGNCNSDTQIGGLQPARLVSQCPVPFKGLGESSDPQNLDKEFRLSPVF